MEPPSQFSPLVHKIAKQVVSSPRRSFSRPTEICLEEWWLSKPLQGSKGLSVSGRPLELRKCNTSLEKLHSAPPKRRFASREFHSAKIVKRHGCTTLETSDGLIVSLCGFINKSRTQQNGFSCEVCRDFIFGFPYNWDDYAKSVEEESSQDNIKKFPESSVPDSLDTHNGAQLHDIVLSLSDSEKESFNEKIYNNLIGMLSPQLDNETTAEPSVYTPSQVIDTNPSSPLTSKPRRSSRIKNRPSYNEEDMQGAFG